MQAATLPRQAPNVRNGTQFYPRRKACAARCAAGCDIEVQPAPSRTPQPQPQEPQLFSSAPLRRTSSGAVLLPGTAYTEYLIYASQHRLAGAAAAAAAAQLAAHCQRLGPDAGDGPETGEEARMASGPAGGAACRRVGAGELCFTERLQCVFSAIQCRRT